MPALSKRRRLGREAVYPVAVLLVTCPKCQAVPGDKCRERFGGEEIFRPRAHLLRYEEAKPKI